MYSNGYHSLGAAGQSSWSQNKCLHPCHLVWKKDSLLIDGMLSGFSGEFRVKRLLGEFSGLYTNPNNHKMVLHSSLPNGILLLPCLKLFRSILFTHGTQPKFCAYSSRFYMVFSSYFSSCLTPHSLLLSLLHPF